MIPWYKRKISNKSGENVSLKGVFEVPVNYTLGMQYVTSLGKISLDNQLMAGTYGGKSTKHMTFWLLRAGWERFISENVILRCGAVVPLKLKTTSLGSLSLPSPGFDASVGGGYRWQNLILDAVLYGDPGNSYVQHQARIGIMLTASVSF